MFQQNVAEKYSTKGNCQLNLSWCISRADGHLNLITLQFELQDYF